MLKVYNRMMAFLYLFQNMKCINVNYHTQNIYSHIINNHYYLLVGNTHLYNHKLEFRYFIQYKMYSFMQNFHIQNIYFHIISSQIFLPIQSSLINMNIKVYPYLNHYSWCNYQLKFRILHKHYYNSNNYFN